MNKDSYYEELIKNLEDRVTKIETRNKTVESDKTWEISITRRLTIAVLTYIIIVLFLFANKNLEPLKNALLPTLGFLLSTLSLSVFKDFWLKLRK